MCGVKMKKLSVIELVSARDTWGGIEQHIKDVAWGLQDRGNKVTIVSRNVEFFVRAYSEICNVYTLPIKSSVDLKSIWGLANIIKQENVDIVHTHTSRDAWMALFATWVAQKGRVFTTRHVPLAAKQDFLHTWYYNKLAGIICVSQFVKSRFIGKSPKINTKHVHVIYPGIQMQTDKPIIKQMVREKLSIDNSKKIVGFVGRITKEKGIDDLFKAISLLKNQKHPFEVALVGEVNPLTPEYLGELKNKANELGITDYIHFYGFTKEVASVMHDIDILVLPSNVPETFGLVLCEAMLAGKPVISTNAGAQGEIVKDGINGFLVPPNSPELIAEKLQLLLTNQELAVEISKNTSQYIVENFSLGRMISELEKAFFKGE